MNGDGPNCDDGDAVVYKTDSIRGRGECNSVDTFQTVFWRLRICALITNAPKTVKKKS